MQQGTVYMNGIIAGVLSRADTGLFAFEYAPAYFSNSAMPAISLTLSKASRRYESEILFPFFAGLLSEGLNKDIQCRALKIDENDDFTRLLRTAGTDTIGAVTIKEEA